MVAYAQQHGYTLVLDGSENQQQAPLVLFANPVHRHHQGDHRSLQREVGRTRSAGPARGRRTQAGFAESHPALTQIQ